MLAGALREQRHAVSHETVAKLLRGLGYSLQSNRKMLEGASHPDSRSGCAPPTRSTSQTFRVSQLLIDRLEVIS